MTVRTINPATYPQTGLGGAFYDRDGQLVHQSENLTNMARNTVLRQMGLAIPTARILYAMGTNELDQ